MEPVIQINRLTVRTRLQNLPAICSKVRRIPLRKDWYLPFRGWMKANGKYWKRLQRKLQKKKTEGGFLSLIDSWWFYRWTRESLHLISVQEVLWFFLCNSYVSLRSTFIERLFVFNIYQTYVLCKKIEYVILCSTAPCTYDTCFFDKFRHVRRNRPEFWTLFTCTENHINQRSVLSALLPGAPYYPLWVNMFRWQCYWSWTLKSQSWRPAAVLIFFCCT